MAQVKKLAKGGGVFEMNGRTLEGQDAIDRVTGHTGETTAGILRAIKNGLRTGYNPESNSPYVTDWEGNDLTEEYLSASKRVSPDDNMVKRVLGTTFNTLGHRYVQESLMLGDVDMTPVKKVDTETPNYTELRRGNGFFNYTTDKDGKKTYVIGPENTDKESILQEGRRYLETLADQGEDAVKKIYTTNGWKNTDLQKLRNWFAQYDTTASRENYWRQLFDRIKSYNLDDTDREVLNLFGFNEISTNGGDEGVEESVVYGNAPEGFTGNKDELKKAGIYITKNKDGVFHANIDPSSKYYPYNVFYLADVPWAPAGYERGFMINGDLYTESDVLNPARTDLHPYVNDWYTADKSNGYKAYYDALNNLGIGFIGSRRWNGTGDDDYGALGNEYDYNTMYNEHLYDYFSNPERGFNGPVNILNATGLYNVPKGGAVYGYLPQGWQDQQGFPELQYIYYDPITKQVVEGVNNLQRSMFRTNRNIDYTDLYNINNKKYHFVTNVGKDSEGNPLNTIIQDFDGNYYLYKVGQNGSIKEPIQLDPKEVEQILKNPNDSKYNESNYFDTIKYKSSSSNKSNNRQNNKYIKPSDANRNNNYYYDRKSNKVIKKNKEGGLLKFQAGGGTSYITTNMNKLDTTSKNDYTANHTLGNGTEEEKKQVYATLADLGALGVSFVNPIAGAIVGGGASIYRYNLDKARGENRAGSRLAMNLALDAASAIPLLGTGMRAARAVNAIRKGGKAFIAGVAAIGGSTELVMTLNKIASGDKWTYDDLNRALSGLSALTVAGVSGVGLRNFGKLASEKAVNLKSVEKLPTAKIKTSKGVKEVQISKKDLKSLTANNKKFANQEELDTELSRILKKSGVKINDSQVKGLSKKFGIEFEKGAKKSKLLNPKSWKNLGEREPGKALFDTTPDAPGSTFYYMMHPEKAANVIGKGTTAAEVKAAQETADKRTWRQKVLLRTTAENPKAFGNMFLNTETGLYSPVTGPLGGGILKSGNVNSRNIINYKPSKSNVKRTSAKAKDDSSIKKVLESETTPKVKPAEPIKTVPQKPDVPPLPPLRQIVDPFFGGIEFKPTMAPKRTVRLTDTGIQYEKKGGKILKGQSGLYTDLIGWPKKVDGKYSWEIDINQQPKDNTLYNRTYIDASLPQYGVDPATKKMRITSPGNLTAITAHNMLSGEAYINPETVNTGVVTDFSKPLNTDKSAVVDTTTKSQDTWLDVPPPESRFDPKHGIEFNEDWGADFARLMQVIGGIRAKGNYLDKSYDEALKVPFIPHQKTMIRYNSAPIEYDIQQALKPWEEFKFVDSDPDRSLASMLTVTDKKSQIEAAGNKEKSNQWYQTELANLDRGDYNNEQRVNMANAKGAHNAEVESLRYNTKANLTSELTNAVQTYMYQHAQDNRNINEYRKAFELQQENAKAAEYYANRIDKALRESGLKAQYEALPLAEQTKYGDISNWLLATNPSMYNKIYTRNKNWYEAEQNINNNYYFDSSKKYPFYIPGRKDILVAKSGGSVYSRRPTNDVIAINGQKQAQKSVDEISKALLQLLHKLMK